MNNDYTRYIEAMKQMLRAREAAFEILGVKTSASNQELKRAYRQACLIYHPDRNQHDPDAHNKFVLIKCAYVLLTEGKPCDRLLESVSQERKRSGNDKYNLDNAWGHFLWWREKFFATYSETDSEPREYHL